MTTKRKQAKLAEEWFEVLYKKQNFIPVYYKGKQITQFNESLVIEREISAESVEKLKRTYIVMHKLFNEMKDSDNVIRLRQLAKRVEAIEFIQQALWKFSIDANFHNWYNVPKCTCPIMDNQQRKGTPYKVIMQSCIIHGGK